MPGPVQLMEMFPDSLWPSFTRIGLEMLEQPSCVCLFLKLGDQVVLLMHLRPSVWELRRTMAGLAPHLAHHSVDVGIVIGNA